MEDADPTDVSSRRPPLTTLITRGWRKKCPRCGQGPLFKRFNILHKRCAICGLKYLAEQGALFGTLSLIDRALFLFPLVALIFFRVYVPSATWFYVLFAVLIFAAIYTLPQRTGLCVALHYLRRRRWGDLR